MLESKEAIANVVEVVQAADFYKPQHTHIYEAIMALYGRGEACDAITVADELARRGQLEGIGGKPYIHGLLEAYPTASSAGYYARIVEEHSMLRSLVDAGNKVQELGFSMPDDVTDAIDQSENLVYEVGNRRLREDMQPVKVLLNEAMVDIEVQAERGEHITGTASGFEDLDDLTAGFQPSNLVIVAARPSMGKCLAATAIIDDLSSGERMTIEQFVQQRRAKVLAVSLTGSIERAGVTDWIPNGRKTCFRLTTRLGRSIEVTSEHPFLTVDGWKPLSALEVGDKVAVPRALGVFGGDASWSLERVRLLAYFIAEGGLTGKSPGVTNFDPFIVSDFNHCVVKEFPTCSLWFPAKRACFRATGGPSRKGKPNPLTDWLREIGLMGKKAEHKRFPAEVWSLSEGHLSEFIKVLFSCDGTIYEVSGYPRIEFAVASEGLAQDVHHALVRFGIVSKLWRKTPRCWRVEITEPESVDRYQESIGWTGEKKLRVFKSSEPSRRPNVGGVPKEAWSFVRKALAGKNMSLAELARRSGEAQNLHTKRTIPYHRLATYARILDDDDLRFLANKDLYWDEVTSIEWVGERDVYDLTIDEHSSFVANDLCVHNSSLMNDFALNAALNRRDPVPVVVFSLEMSRQEVVKRFLSSEARVDSQRIGRGTLQEQDWGKLSSALGRLAEAPIFIDDSAHITLMEIRAKCRRLKAKHGLGLIVVDYLQLMQSPRRSENRQQEVSEISRGLKILARDLEVAVVCASQLNRGVEMRSDKRPLLGDLRESGSIEQDSDLVMFLYRDEVYNKDSEARGEAELILAKHRNGPTGTVRLAFMNQYTKFASLAKGIN